MKKCFVFQNHMIHKTSFNKKRCYVYLIILPSTKHKDVIYWNNKCFRINEKREYKKNPKKPLRSIKDLRVCHLFSRGIILINFSLQTCELVWSTSNVAIEEHNCSELLEWYTRVSNVKKNNISLILLKYPSKPKCIVM